MRGWKVLLVFVVILGGLFVAADRLAVHFAEGKVADRIESGQRLENRPVVSVRGFPFLTQVASKRLNEVDIALDGVKATAQGHSVRVTRVRAVLRDVRVNSSFSAATAASAEGSARISYADLAVAVPKGAAVSWAGAARAAKGQVKVVGDATEVLKEQDIPVPSGVVADALKGKTITAYGTVTMANGNTLRLHIDDVGGLPIPGLDDQIKGLINSSMRIDGMPSTVRLSTVVVTPEGLRFSGTGTNVSLTG